jgi:hypothetical protein
MNRAKYIGMDVQKEAISIVVMNAARKLIIESTLFATRWNCSRLRGSR